MSESVRAGGRPRLGPGGPLALELTEVVRSGTAVELQQLLYQHPALAHERLGDECGQSRTLLHVVIEWPGHVPEAGVKIRALAAAGADVDARFTGPHTETLLRWAASSDDVEALDALLDAGADIESDGAVIGNGTPDRRRRRVRVVKRGAAAAGARRPHQPLAGRRARPRRPRLRRACSRLTRPTGSRQCAVVRGAWRTAPHGEAAA